MITIKKTFKAQRGYGRGHDNKYFPAEYGVFDGDVMVGLIRSAARGCYDSADWELSRMEGDIPRTMRMFNTLAQAKAFALKAFSAT